MMDELFQFLERGLMLVDKYGIGLTIVTLMLIAAVKYGPKLIAAFHTFLSTSADTQQRLTRTIESQGANLEAHQIVAQGHFSRLKESHEMACRCGHHFCDVIETVGKKLDIEDKIVDSIESIRRELERTKAQ
jgi:hypothetical protein